MVAATQDGGVEIHLCSLFFCDDALRLSCGPLAISAVFPFTGCAGLLLKSITPRTNEVFFFLQETFRIYLEEKEPYFLSADGRSRLRNSKHLGCNSLPCDLMVNGRDDRRTCFVELG